MVTNQNNNHDEYEMIYSASALAPRCIKSDTWSLCPPPPSLTIPEYNRHSASRAHYE